MEFTARKWPAAALRESKEAYRSLFLGLRRGVALCEILYDERGEAHDYRIFDVNPAYEAIFEVTREEAVGSKASELYQAGCVSHLKLYARVAATGEPATFDFETTFRPTQRRSFRITALATGNGRFATVFEDITERKALEQQLYQAQKMEEIGQLAGGVAHDFNNLLTAILGYSHLVLDQLGNDDSRRADIEEIRKAGERAVSLTRQLLVFSRRQILKPVVLDLNAVIANMGKMLRRIIGEDIKVVMRLDPDLGYIKADAAQIGQIIVNLAVNARDAMHGGTLTIGTRNLDLDEASARKHASVIPGPYVMLAVSDTGRGMHADTQARIFEPFFTTKGPGKGTGLGLSTVLGIVKQSGGYITVESRLGVGTTVTSYFPRVDAQVESKESVARPDHPAEAIETILLVEDDVAVRELARRVLQERGYTVLPARDVADAIALEANHSGPIHLLLSDIVMPELNGPDLAQRFVRRRPMMKVLYVSGFALHSAIAPSSASQHTAILQKPFTPETLSLNVRELLDRRAGLDGQA